MIMKRKGSMMIELLLVVGIIVGFLSFFYTNIYIPQKQALAAKEDFKNQILLKRLLNQYIKVVASYNKSLYTKNVLVSSDDFVQLEPKNGDITDRLSFSLSKVIIDTHPFMNKDLLQAKCLKVSEDTEYYDYRCLGVDSEINFLQVEKTGHIFNNIYSNNIPVFSMRKLIKGNFIGKNEFTFLDTYLLFREKSLKKISILSKRLEAFSKTAYITEIGNPCSFTGGLDSWDDFNVPWVWKIHSLNNPQSEKCEETLAIPAKITCGCASMTDTDKWSDDGSLVKLDANINVAAYELVLKNLSLPRLYKYDEVGNPISIYIFAKIDQGAPTPLTLTPPNVPKENYEVDVGMNINQYKQGEIFVRPGYINAGLDNFLEDSRTVFFYD